MGAARHHVAELDLGEVGGLEADLFRQLLLGFTRDRPEQARLVVLSPHRNLRSAIR